MVIFHRFLLTFTGGYPKKKHQRWRFLNRQVTGDAQKSPAVQSRSSRSGRSDPGIPGPSPGTETGMEPWAMKKSMTGWWVVSTC